MTLPYVQESANAELATSINGNIQLQKFLPQEKERAPPFVQSRAAYRSRGFEDEDLGSSPCLFGQ